MSIFSVAILVAAVVVTSVATFVVTLAVFHYIYINATEIVWFKK